MRSGLDRNRARVRLIRRWLVSLLGDCIEVKVLISKDLSELDDH